MSNFVLESIPKPPAGTATVLQMETKGRIPVIVGVGSDNYLCGACSNVLAKGVDRGQVANVVIVCPDCGAYNLVRGT